jgi:hypothetical protein
MGNVLNKDANPEPMLLPSGGNTIAEALYHLGSKKLTTNDKTDTKRKLITNTFLHLVIKTNKFKKVEFFLSDIIMP